MQGRTGAKEARNRRQDPKWKSRGSKSFQIARGRAQNLLFLYSLPNSLYSNSEDASLPLLPTLNKVQILATIQKVDY